MFRLARASAVKSRTQAINQLKAVIVTAEAALHETLTSLSNTALIRHCAAPPTTTPTDVAAVYTLRHLGQRIQALNTEERELQRQFTALLRTHAPRRPRSRAWTSNSEARSLVVGSSGKPFRGV